MPDHDEITATAPQAARDRAVRCERHGTGLRTRGRGGDRAGARRRRAAARRADALRPRRLDRRQRLGPRARRRPLRDQAVGRLVRRPRAREHDPLRPRRQRGPGHAGQRAQPVERHRGARLRVPATCPRSAASCTPTRRSRSPGPRAARRSRASSRRWPTSSAARSRSARSRSSATTRSAAASSRPSPGHRSPRGAHAEPRAVHDRRRREGRGQGRRHGRGCRAHRALRPRGRPADPDPAGGDRPPLRPLPERVRQSDDAATTQPDEDAADDRVHEPAGRGRRGARGDPRGAHVARHRARLDAHQGVPRRRGSDDVLAVGSHEWENRFVDRVWTYSLEDVWSGLQAAYADLVADVRRRYDVQPQTFGAIGVSAMMHGYLAFDADDELLVPFRTWRNTSTGPAAAELSERFGLNIPLRWSIAHLYQAVLDDEPHVPQIGFLTTLAGYVHWRLTGRKAIGVGDASGMFPIDAATHDYDARLLAVFDGLVADRAPGLRVADLLPEVLPAGRQAGQLTAEGAALLDPSGALRPGAAALPARGRRRHRHGRDELRRPAHRQRQRGHEHLRDGRARAPARARPPRARPRHHAGGRPRGDGALQQRRQRARGLGGPVRAVRRGIRRAGRRRRRVRGALPRGARGRGRCRRPARLQPPRGRADRGTRRGAAAVRAHARQPVHASRTSCARSSTACSARSRSACACSPTRASRLDRMFAHGGIFRTAGVAQRFLAGALDAPVAVGETASEGGAWGIAVLASYLSSADEVDLGTYLERARLRGRRDRHRRPRARRRRRVLRLPRPLPRRTRRRGRRRRRPLTERATAAPRADTHQTHRTPHHEETHMTRTPLTDEPRRVRGLVPHRQPAPLRPRDPPAGRRAVAAGRRDARRGIRRAREGRVEAGAHRLRRDPAASPSRRTPPTTSSASSRGCTRSAPPRCGSPASTRCRSRSRTCTRRRTSSCRGATSTSTS